MSEVELLVASTYNTIPKLSSWTSESILRISKKCSIAYDTKNLWDHLKLLNRLIYRSNNQHKASFAFKHLKEIKRIAERIGKVELWLKENFDNQGQKLFDVIGFANTLRVLVDKALEACRKTFYFYAHYVDQALFVPLALVAIGTISKIHAELMQWSKYLRIFHNTNIEKLEKQSGSGKVDEWCKSNFISKNLDLFVNQSPLQISKTEIPQKLPIQPEGSQKRKLSINKQAFHLKNKKDKKQQLQSSHSDEIDDIFNSL